MTSRAFPFTLLVAAIGFLGAAGVSAWAEGGDSAALAAAMKNATAIAGSRAVSIVPELKNGQATAEVTLLQGTAFKKVTEKLD